MSRIGIFGGTFDPPHYAHLILAEHTVEQLELDKVLWVPAGDPPHKQGEKLSPIENRIEMLELALAGNPAFSLSRVDAERPGPHYTVDMVRVIAEIYPESDLFFLMGGDSLDDLMSWHKPEQLITLSNIAVMHRPSTQVDMVRLEKVLPGLSERVEILDAPLVEIASSVIRDYCAGGRSIRYMLPDAVRKYIDEHMLYHREPEVTHE